MDGGNISVDGRGFVWVDGVRVCRYVRERGTLAFIDRDRRRIAARGGVREVEVSVEDMANIKSQMTNADSPGFGD